MCKHNKQQNPELWLDSFEGHRGMAAQEVLMFLGDVAQYLTQCLAIQCFSYGAIFLILIWFEGK